MTHGRRNTSILSLEVRSANVTAKQTELAQDAPTIRSAKVLHPTWPYSLGTATVTVPPRFIILVKTAGLN